MKNRNRSNSTIMIIGILFLLSGMFNLEYDDLVGSFLLIGGGSFIVFLSFLYQKL